MNDCIEWHMARDKDGYGRKQYRGKARRAHRLAYVEHHGPSLEDIDGMVVMHTCDNPPCVNIEHLRLGTVADNTRDMDLKGRRGDMRHPNFGTKNGRAKLTDGEVLAIRFLHAAAGTPKRQLGRTFGVHSRQVGRIIHGQHRLAEAALIAEAARVRDAL